MPVEVILPRVDMDMATGKISKWLVSDGTRVEKGQPLFEIETDKAAMEIEAEASGTIRSLKDAGGGDLAVGSVVAWIFGEGEPEAASEARTADARTSEDPAPPTAPTLPLAPQGPADGAPAGGDAPRPRATPLARRLARERGLDLTDLSGSGPRGRLQAADVPRLPARGEGQIPARAPDTTPSTPPSASPLLMLRAGAGTPIVLLHGFGSDAKGWRPFLAGYESGRPVLALDLPGHGAAPLGERADFTALVDAVEAALLATGATAFHLVGHSLGGAVAAAVAARGALDLRSLLLIAPAGLGPDINGAFLQGYLGATCEASLAPWMRELVTAPEVITPAFVRATLTSHEASRPLQRRLAAALFPDGTQAFSIRQDLARIACPARVVVGIADRIIPARHADSLPGLVALHRLAGIGHMPHIECRGTVQAILAETVRDRTM